MYAHVLVRVSLFVLSVATCFLAEESWASLWNLEMLLLPWSEGGAAEGPVGWPAPGSEHPAGLQMEARDAGLAREGGRALDSCASPSGP